MAKLGKALGVAYVRIRGDSTKLKGDLNTAHGQVVAAGKRMAMGLGVVGLAVAGVGLAIKNLSKEWIRLANEQEAVEKRLGAVVKASGNAAGLATKEMIEMAGAMQKITTSGDETIISGMAILATFKNIRTEAFERTTMAALDMSEVMQQDLRSSMVMLGKALNDPIANLSALSRAGVQFTKEQKEMVKVLWEAGNVIGAQTVILKELESQFGGAAKAARDTYGGAVKALGNVVGDLKEELGFAITKNEVFIKMVQDTERYIISLIPHVKEAAVKFQNWIKQNRLFIEQDIPKYIRSMGDAFKYIKTVYDSFPDGMKGASGAGIVGWILFGAMGGAQIAAMVYAVNSALIPLNSNIGAIGDSAKGAYWALDDLVQALLGNRKGYAADLETVKRIGALSLEQQKLQQTEIGITPPDYRSGLKRWEPAFKYDAKKIKPLDLLTYPSELGATGAEQGVMSSAQMADQSADFVKQAKAEYEGLMMGATDSFMGMAEANKRANDIMEEQTKTTSFNMSQLTERTAWSMQENFSSVFYDAVTGELKSFEDYARAIFLSISQAWADMMAQMLTQSIFGNELKGGGGLDSLVGFAKGLLGLGGGSFKATGASGAFNIGQFGTTAFGMAGGGYLGEDVVGIGRKTGSSYELHADEYVVPPDKLRGGGDGQNTNVNINITAMDSKDVQRVLSENKGLIGNLVGGQMMRNQSLRSNVKMASR